MIQNPKRKSSKTDSVRDGTARPDRSASVVLPRPRLYSGTPVSKALQRRKTTREISDRKLSLQQLSNLLWAACGINRKKGPFEIPGKTAASASNSQEVDLYVVMEQGVYLYDPFQHRINKVLGEDIRSLAINPGQASFIVDAPVHLIYVADINKLVNTCGYQEPGLRDPEVQKSYYYVDTGLIAANVYLFAASEGMAAWFHNCNKPALKEKLSLRPDQRVLFGQTVGYAKRKP